MLTANRGWRSSKLHLALITMVLIVGGWIWAGAPIALYSEMCTALVMTAALYVGPATVEKFLRPRQESLGPRDVSS